MTLSFNSLVLIPSDHCNITCRHCAPECGPVSKQPWDVPLLKQCITDASHIASLGKTVHLAGGEPFLYFPQMLEVARHARQSGLTCSAVTNGFWGVNAGRAGRMISSLAESGLNRVELSTDAFHQEYIPVETVRRAIQVLKSAGVCVILRVVTSRKHTVDETLRQLRAEDLDGVEVAGSPVVPVGRAREAVPPQERYLSDCGACGACHSLLNLTVRPDGSVFPCCAGSETNPALSLGNLYETSVDAVVQAAEWNVLVKKLVQQGPASFFPILEDAGLGHKIQPEYTNVCHVCTDLFADPEVVHCTRQWAFRVQQESLAGVLKDTLDAGAIDLDGRPLISSPSEQFQVL